MEENDFVFNFTSEDVIWDVNFCDSNYIILNTGPQTCSLSHHLRLVLFVR